MGLISDLPDPCQAVTDEKACLDECAWSKGSCSHSKIHVSCGGHGSPSCALCPDGHGESWCNGDCDWRHGKCSRDVARYGTASQSSDYQDDNLDMKASKAINGNTSGNCGNHQCSHTDYEYRPWWKVDLHNIYLINTIVIWNRSDCCMDRLNNAELKIYRDDILVDTKNLGYMSYTRKKEFNYSGISGNIVKVQLPGSHYLQLSEVQVFGSLMGDLPHPCQAVTDEKACLGECAWSKGSCSHSKTHVSCGGHQSPSCALCPDGHGESWCNGDCDWWHGECMLTRDADNAICSSKTSGTTCLGECAWSNGGCSYSEKNSWCGGHQAPTCSECPDGHGSAWCNGECSWHNGGCVETSSIKRVKFVPSSPLTKYHDHGSCGPRGDDADADFSKCSNGHTLVDHKLNDNWKIAATVNGCDYYAYWIYECKPVKFDPKSPLTKYHDHGGCGPRGDDAMADFSQCAHGHELIRHVPNDNWKIAATVNGCDYYAYWIYACKVVTHKKFNSKEGLKNAVNLW